MLELGPREPGPPRRIAGVVIGTLVDLDSSGGGQVAYPGSGCWWPLTARSTVPLGRAEVGRSVALLFEEGDPDRPVVMGLVQPPSEAPAGAHPGAPAEGQRGLQVQVDGERVVFTAQKELVLRCGEASITLTRAGKVLIRGAYVLSRSSGVNKIKGGSVRIN
jgi:hypothetical protein